MSTINGALWVLVPLSYLVAWNAYRLCAREDRGHPGRFSLGLVMVALVLHLVLVGVRWSLLGQLPLTTIFDALSALAFLMTLTYALVEVVTRERSTGSDLLIIPLVLVTYAHALGSQTPVPNPKIDDPTLFIAHTLPAVGGFAAILVGGMYGILYLRLFRELQQKKFDRLFQRLPDLQTLAAMNFRANVIGVILVTGAIGWGATWYGDQVGRVNVFEPKIFITLVLWFILLLPILGRLTRRWNDRWTALVGVVSLGLVVISWIVSMLPFVGFHGHR